MKVTLDLTKLREEGRITQAEYDKLSGLAAEGTGAVAFNILVGFGIVAVGGAALALVPTPMTAIVIGLVVGAIGGGLLAANARQWGLLAQICILAGAVMVAGGIIKFGEGSIASFALVTVLFAVAGIAARSGLLMVGAVLALSSCLGARTAYFHAAYFLGIQEPLLTIVVFSALALVTYLISKQLPAAYERLALIAARASLFMVNFGFWIGSLWGDRLVWLRQMTGEQVDTSFSFSRRATVVIPDWQFAVVWAIALIAVAVWAARANRPWVLNLAAVFGAIHFYTQWFEHLGANPISVLVAGLIALAIAFAIWTMNHRRAATA
jgi:iron complex transport system permease protein